MDLTTMSAGIRKPGVRSLAPLVSVLVTVLAQPQHSTAATPISTVAAATAVVGALPAQSTIISDDFNVGCGGLGGPWTFVDPLGDGGLRFTGGGTSNALVELSVPAGVSHDVWTNGNFAPRIMQPANDTDFEIEVKFESLPEAPSQGQGMIVEQSPGDFLRFDVYSGGGSLNLFAASFVGGTPTVHMNTPIASSAPIYLRVVRVGDQWTQSHSSDGQVWTTGANFIHILTVSSVGAFALNTAFPASNSPAFAAAIDYFFNTAAPIDPEDGGAPPNTADPQTLTVTVTGNGTVGRSPDQPSYTCGEVVTLTAVPDADHNFAGWSGDVSGETNPVTVTMIGDRLIFANFASNAPPRVPWTQLSSTTGDLQAPNTGAQQTACLTFDIDNDGVKDFVIAERTQSPSVVWYRRDLDGWTRHVVDEAILKIEAGGTFNDIDGDGDLDLVLCGDFQSPQIWWWENPAPNFSPTVPWARRLIKSSGANKHHDAAFGDVDGDGAVELVAWNQGGSSLLLFDIPLDPLDHAGEWSRTAIASVTPSFEGLAIADMDLDGTLDIVGAGRWYGHVVGTTFDEHVIDNGPGREFTRTAVGQLIPGGRPEVVIVPGDANGPLRWYFWDATAWVATDIDINVIRGHSLAVEDIDGDGHLDIFVAEMGSPGHGVDATAWVYFGDSTGNFQQQVVSVGVANHESKVADLDGDGDVDILSKPFSMGAPRLDVFLNSAPPLSLDLWARHVIDANKPWRAIFIDGADVDGDTRTDIVTGGWWYQNPGTPAGAWTRHDLGAPLNNMAAVADFDGDGALDVLGTQGVGAAADARFVWAHNDGLGGFTIHQNVPVGNGDFLQGVVVGRFGPLGTGPLEVALSWHATGMGVQMLTVPNTPLTQNWTWRLLSTTSQDEQLTGGDIDLDLDGDADLLLGTAWLRNQGATWGSFALSATSAAPDRSRLADINGDGRIDAVVGFEAINVPGDIVWYEQPADPTSIWQEHLIATLIGPMSLDVADMDGDGSLDVIVGEHNLANPQTAGLFVFANTGGDGLFWAQHTVFVGDEHHDGAVVVDIDEDGDNDILSIGWGHSRVLLYENQAIVSTTAPIVIDVALRAVDIASPTTPEEGALPAGIGVVCPGRDFFVEVWVSQVDGGNDGLTGGSVDLLFDGATVTATGVDHGSVFNDFLFPSTTDVGGLVDDLGGTTLAAGTAVGPNWALLARVSVAVTGSGPFTFSLDHGAFAFALAGAMPPLANTAVDVSTTLTVDIAVVDDANACTNDVCDAATGVVTHPNNFDPATTCCDPSTGTTTLIDDGNTCTNDVCDATTGLVTHPNNSNPCNDGNACTTGDACSTGTCVGGAPPDCDDGDVCTDDSCNPATGCVNTNNTAACDDGNACTTTDTCSLGLCVGGAAPNCNDANVCTNDSCNPATGCVNTNNTAACDDGNACTTDDTCSLGACVSGVPPNCDDSNVCTDDSCNPPTGCVNTNNILPCNDGNACTTSDTCSLGLCVGGAALNCNDANVCTNDSCNPATGCVNSNNTAACNDGDACTTSDTCSLGVCVGGAAPNCDDGNVCTDDSCTPPIGCVNTNNILPCNDGDACTTGDTCSLGLCVGGAAPNCDDTNICTDDSCNSATGCVNSNNTAACDDSDACTTSDTCSLGVCVGGAAPNCDDGNVCTDDSCTPPTGCVNTNNILPCNDGDACTTSDTCSLGLCVGGAAPNCDDGNVCTDDSCDIAAGCQNITNSVPCNDGDACTMADTCSLGVCVGGAPPNCDDGNVCTTDVCDIIVGCVNSALIYDLDESGVIDFSDLALFAPHFASFAGDPAYSPCADFYFDAVIESADVSFFGTAIGKPCADPSIVLPDAAHMPPLGCPAGPLGAVSAVNAGDGAVSLEVSAVILRSPSSFTSSDILPRSVRESIVVRSVFVVELWVQMSGEKAAGLTGGSLSLQFDPQLAQPLSATTDARFGWFQGGETDADPGWVSNVAGATLDAGVGVGLWVRFASVEFAARRSGVWRISPSQGHMAFAQYAVGAIAPDVVTLTGARVTIQEVATLRPRSRRRGK